MSCEQCCGYMNAKNATLIICIFIVVIDGLTFAMSFYDSLDSLRDEVADFRCAGTCLTALLALIAVKAKIPMLLLPMMMMMIYRLIGFFTAPFTDVLQRLIQRIIYHNGERRVMWTTR
ncbi:hypothetical protein QR680_004080 [Steinernema hermaphroditum]|uniref:Inner membrane protein YqiJ N-terminal domain-containing protein n=1 Tax=Steinernema hermaphroditum TaxID=289476 RepID=A0AA39HNN2_9BILA|nr:hypothetical protein QR680_004080 [Steinernema hermaphroditum]